MSVSFRIRPGQAGISCISAFQSFTTFGCGVESEIWGELFFYLCHWDVKQKASACNKFTSVLSNTQWRSFQQIVKEKRLHWEYERADCLSTDFGGIGFTSALQSIMISFSSFSPIPCPGSAADSGCAKAGVVFSITCLRTRGLPGCWSCNNNSRAEESFGEFKVFGRYCNEKEGSFQIMQGPFS